MDGYLLLRALHVTAIATWSGGMVANALVLRHGRAAPGLLQGMRLWDSHVSTVAMVLTWVLGLVLAIQGGWFSQGWLHAKLLLVLLLSALQGMQSAGLRRLDNKAGEPKPLAMQPWLPLAGLLLIALLATTKPF
ncbi:CopD family protein [Roseomonas sp. USHLN139]|uniref:CopD family protein n=1 Tax=Roseomonas sp. USHLN139 TaxID=3081298 RepID=UPI003B027067